MLQMMVNSRNGRLLGVRFICIQLKGNNNDIRSPYCDDLQYLVSTYFLTQTNK